MVRSQGGRIEELVRFFLQVLLRLSFGLSDLDVVFRPHGGDRSWRYIPSLQTYNTFSVRYFTIIHLEETTTTWSTLLSPSMHSITIASSSRARSDPLSACTSRFLLGEESKVMLEQFELCALRKSTLPRHYLVIYFSKFLPAKGVNSQKITLIKQNGPGATTKATRSPRSETSSRQRRHRLRGIHRLRDTAT